MKVHYYEHKSKLITILTKIAYLFEIERDGDPVVLDSVCDGGALPPVVGAIYGVLDGMAVSLVPAVRVAHITLFLQE